MVIDNAHNRYRELNETNDSALEGQREKIDFIAVTDICLKRGPINRGSNTVHNNTVQCVYCIIVIMSSCAAITVTVTGTTTCYHKIEISACSPFFRPTLRRSLLCYDAAAPSHNLVSLLL